MKYFKYLLIIPLISILFCEDDAIVKIYFKDGSYKIGYIDRNYSDSHIKLVSIDGGWAIYQKKTIKDIQYEDINVKSASKDPNSVTMISFGSADINGLEGQSNAQSFKYAFYIKKTEKIYSGFSISGWDENGREEHNYSRNIKYLIGYSYLKFSNNSHKGFYYSLDGGVSYIVATSERHELFGISPFGILSITQEAGYNSSGLKSSRQPFGIGINITTGYSFGKVMISCSLAHSKSPANKDFGDFDITNSHTSYYSAINLSYLF